MDGEAMQINNDNNWGLNGWAKVWGMLSKSS